MPDLAEILERLLDAHPRLREHFAAYPIAQARLNLVWVEVARQRELTFKVTHLVLLVDRAVPSRRVLLHLSPDTQHATLQRDGEPLRLGSGHVGQQHQAALGLVDVHPWSESQAGPGPSRRQAQAHRPGASAAGCDRMLQSAR